MIARLKMSVLMLLAVLGLWGVGKVHAAVDTPSVEKLGAQQYCSEWARHAIYGAARYFSVAPEVRKRSLLVRHQTIAEDQADPSNPVTVLYEKELHAQVIFMTEGQGWAYDAENIAWMEGTVQEGWKWMEEFLAQNASISREQLATMPVEMWVQKMAFDCAGKESKKAPLQKSEAHFYRASQNEHLGDPSVDRIRKCDWLAQKLELAGAMRGGFESADAMLVDIPFPEGWSEEIKEWVRSEVKLMFGFIGGNAEFVKQRRMVCLHK